MTTDAELEVSEKVAEKAHDTRRTDERGLEMLSAAADGDKLTRSQVARLLGVSASTVRRLEGNVLHPEVIEGTHVFQVSEVTALAVHRRETNGAGGEVAAEVFSLLEDGVHPIEIVKRAKYDVDVVERLYERWKTWRRRMDVGQGIRVSAEDIQRIAAISERFQLSGPSVCESADDIVRLIEANAKDWSEAWSK